MTDSLSYAGKAAFEEEKISLFPLGKGKKIMRR